MLDFVIAIFAVYRVSVMLAKDRGPFGIFQKFRATASNRFGENHWFTVGVGCPRCISFWLSIIAAVIITPVQLGFWYGVLIWLAVAGGVYVIATIIQLYEFNTFHK